MARPDGADRPAPAGRPGPRGRLAGAAPAAARRGRPGRLPDRAGVADQRDPARRAGHRGGRRWTTPPVELLVEDDSGRAIRPTPAPRRARPAGCGTGHGLTGCASGPRRSAARLTAGLPTATAARGQGFVAVTTDVPGERDGWSSRDPGAAGRRPGADPGRVPGAAGAPTRSSRSWARRCDGRQAVTLARRERADVVLMDIRMPEMDGLEATRLIAADEDLAGVKVIILTTFESDEYVFQALRAGASGFLVKDTEPADLLQAIRIVARGRRAAVAQRDPAADRRPGHPPGRARARRGQAAGRADRAGAGGAGPGGRRAVQRGDRRPAVPEPAHGQDPRQPDR